MDRWRHDCGARRVRIISRPGSPMSEGRFDLSTFRSERTNEASTLTITPKRSSSRDVGTSSYRYHTATCAFEAISRMAKKYSNRDSVGRNFRFCISLWTSSCTVEAGAVFNMFAIAAISSRQTIVNKYLQNNKGVNWNGLTVDDFVVVVFVVGFVVVVFVAGFVVEACLVHQS
ncbi:hypothetical protein TNCV_2919201 [Trichonephila clavipes]|nr:hypothetical protein TNCV_2919201 [Trichonephila clavipes]